MLEQKAEVPVLGVTPYMQLDIEEEDSLTERFHVKKEVELIDIAVIRLPKISNFTDFNILENIKGVSLRYVGTVSELKNPDMIIIPGTKNTMEDMLWLRQSGLEAAILKKAAENKVIFGICGGFQMLGDNISDPDGVEAGGVIKGMNLLPMDTVFQGNKIRTRVTGRFGQVKGILSDLSGEAVEGYEIHMGISYFREKLQNMTSVSNLVDGEEKLDGAYYDNIYGSYIHGIFDKEQIATKVITCLAKAKNIDLDQISSRDYSEHKELQYNILADTLRQHLHMPEIYAILNG
jgi:adenosylcobyric acid synthase